MTMSELLTQQESVEALIDAVEQLEALEIFSLGSCTSLKRF